MDAETIITTLRPLVPGASYEVGRSIDFPTVYVPADKLVDTCRALRDTPSLAFNAIIEITAADYLPHEPRFEVVYHLLSVPNRMRVRLKVRVAGSAAPEGVIPRFNPVGPGPGGRACFQGPVDLAGSRLARARSVGHVRDRVRRSPRSAPPADARRLGRASRAQGLPGADQEGGADLRAAGSDRGRVQGEHGAGSGEESDELGRRTRADENTRWLNCAPKR